MTKSEQLRRRIIWHLRHVWRWCEGSNSWRSFDKLSEEVGSRPHIVKREVRRLARMGALRHSIMCDMDGLPCGSGYFLTFEWERHKPGRESDPADDEFSVPVEEDEEALPPPVKGSAEAIAADGFAVESL